MRRCARHGLGVLTDEGGTVYIGSFVNNRKQGQGLEKTPDGASYDGPFSEGRRHGVGVVTTIMPITVDPSTVWDGSDDSGWIKQWTVDKPEMSGEDVMVRVAVTTLCCVDIRARSQQTSHVDAVVCFLLDGARRCLLIDRYASEGL